MDLATFLHAFPHLATPAHLAAADQPGKFRLPRHLAVVNKELIQAVAVPSGGRLMINMPYQHGKTTLASHYFPAWYLLTRPEKRVTLVSSDHKFAEMYGSRVREIVDTFGDPLGVRLRADTKAKRQWTIDKFGGWMMSRGPKGGVGYPSDLFIIDDLIKDADQALSAATMESHWNFYKTVVFGRLRAGTSCILIGTRWGKNDLFGRIVALSKRTGEKWRHVKFKAIATEDDPLGRKPGEALWPQQVPLSQHEIARAEWGPWFDAAWQQEPRDEEGAYFKPRGGKDDKGNPVPPWPTYKETPGAFVVPDSSLAIGRRIIPSPDVLKLITVDWATSEKKTADFTAMGVFGLLPDGRMVVLEVFNERIALEACVPKLASLCRKWRPSLVGVESGGFQTALAIECRRYHDIPEVRQLRAESKNKLRRAVPAIVMGENARILLPEAAPWLDGYVSQLASFTGVGDDHDDMVDCTSYAAQQAQLLRARPQRASSYEDYGPCLLVPGKEMDW
jgi:predicted phage terminase large subunit-like protein